MNDTVVELPAVRLLGAALITNWLSPAAVTTMLFDAEPATVLPTLVSVAEIVCRPALSSVAVTVASPPENETLPKESRYPPNLARLTVSEKLVATLPN